VPASLKVADVDEGVRPSLTAQQSIEPRRRNKVLEQENEVLRGRQRLSARPGRRSTTT